MVVWRWEKKCATEAAIIVSPIVRVIVLALSDIRTTLSKFVYGVSGFRIQGSVIVCVCVGGGRIRIALVCTARKRGDAKQIRAVFCRHRFCLSRSTLACFDNYGYPLHD